MGTFQQLGIYLREQKRETLKRSCFFINPGKISHHSTVAEYRILELEGLTHKSHFLPTSWKTLDKLPKPCILRFPHPENGANNSIYLIGLFSRLKCFSIYKGLTK